MFYRLSVLLLAFLALEIASPGTAAPQSFSSPSTIEEVLVAEQHLATAVSAGHDASVDRLVADDARMTSATGQFFDGASWEARMLGRTRRELPVPTALEIRLYRNLALVHGRATIADPAPRDVYVMRAWVEAGETWQLAAQHTTDITKNARSEPPTFATLGQKIPAGPTHTAPDASARKRQSCAPCSTRIAVTGRRTSRAIAARSGAT